ANTLNPGQTGGYTITLTRATTDCTSVALTSGTTVNGSLVNGDCRLLEDSSCIDAYTFSGTAGGQVSITMTSTSAGLVPVLFLLSPTGASTAVDFNADGDNTARIPGGTATFTLPVAGTYTVLANSFAANQSGSYTLRLVDSTVNLHRISGSVRDASGAGVPNVGIKLGGDLSAVTTTSDSGAYSFEGVPGGGHYTVTPSHQHYTFAPPSVDVANLTSDQAVNFTGTLNTYRIGGRITDNNNNAIAGVTVNLSGAQAGTTTTDASGNYAFANLPAGGNYTVTPASTPLYLFTSQNVPILNNNETLNFVGALRTYAISGRISIGGAGGLSGVTVMLSGQRSATAITDIQGNYSFMNLSAGGNYTVRPATPHYTFAPERADFTSLSSNGTANFAAALNNYMISGQVTSGDGPLGNVTLILSGSLTGSVVTDAAGRYSFTLPAGGSYTVTPERPNYKFEPVGRSFNNLSANQSGANFTGARQLPTVQFEAANYQFNEGDAGVTFNLIRTGDTSGTVTVNYETVDTDTFTVGCADQVNNQGAAYGRCDFATSVGIISFSPGETTKSINVPLIDDGHQEGDETFHLRLSNASEATLGTRAATMVTIHDNDGAASPNPVTASFSFFVRQQYLDFLSREADAAGRNAWIGVLNGCANAFNGPAVPSGCDRIFVSGEGFFRSQEFQLKGFYVFRFYKLAFNRMPEYLEAVADMSFVAGQTPEEVYARKAQLATLITERLEFRTAYGGLSNAQYVAALLARYNLTQVTTPDPAQPDGGALVTLTGGDLTNRLDALQLTRAQVLRAVADSERVGALEFDNAFVGMQYYGYLRRKPDAAGFEAWLGVLRSGDVRTMVNGFLNSTEYKLRFGQP
ncbi:MAG TPA: carboxypeptidase regulatory-like domain-containing protein, partial [Pyrinomonadaceae bacterium]